MKKVLQYLLICMMIFVCIGICGVGADEITVNGLAGNDHKVIDREFTPVTVTYGVTTETYTIVIPSAISFATFESVVEDKVSVSKVTLARNTILNVTVDSTNDFKMSAYSGDEADDISYEMDYWLNNGDEISTAKHGELKYHDPFVVLTIDGVSAAETPLKFRLVDMPVELGTYEDVLTFRVSINR